MPLRLPISLSLLLLWLPIARAQLAPADDFFHSGAQCYITNNIAKAREAVDAGLKLYPEDIKLKKLDELLKQQQQSQNDQSKQQNQQNQNQQSKQDQKDQDKQQQSKDNQQSQNQQQAQQKPDNEKSKEQKENQQQARTAKAAPMTPQQAERLLDSQKGSEQVLWFKPGGRPEDSKTSTKDW